MQLSIDLGQLRYILREGIFDICFCSRVHTIHIYSKSSWVGCDLQPVRMSGRVYHYRDQKREPKQPLPQQCYDEAIGMQETRGENNGDELCQISWIWQSRTARYRAWTDRASPFFTSLSLSDSFCSSPPPLSSTSCRPPAHASELSTWDGRSR